MPRYTEEQLRQIEPALDSVNPLLYFYDKNGKYLHSSKHFRGVRHAWAHNRHRSLVGSIRRSGNSEQTVRAYLAQYAPLY